MFDVKTFENPGVEYRSIPFWSLNGKLTKKELKRQILNMKRMGFGGAFLHSRTGLETEYLSEEWMNLMEYCKDVLRENGMLVYLYDEDRYPSGTCGGTVTAKKEFREKSMNLFEVTDFSAYHEPKECIALFALRLGERGKLVSYRRITDFSDVSQNEKVYCFYVYYMPGRPFYNGNSMVDCMNRDATEAFLASTHEKYRKRFGKLFGTDITGIFTDEPSRGPMFTGFSHDEPGAENLIPYTYALFDEFRKRKGYSLEEKLPELWFGLESDAFVKTTYDYVEILEELFLENFAVPYRDWCSRNHLKFTGHILHEDNLAAQVNMSGSMMRFYEYFDYPGMDNLGPANYCYTVPALVRSVGNQLGKDYVLDELYGVSGWPMKIEDYKRIGDWQSAGGITLRVPHLSWYTMKGEAKRDCPASIFHQSAWYREYRFLEDYYARLTYLLKEGKTMTDTAIINPIESVWGLANKNAYHCFAVAKEENFARLEKEYAELYKGLLLNGRSADYIDEGLFTKYGKVDGKDFCCGKMRYRTILLNGNLNLRKTTLDALKQFIASGGKVIIVGRHPSYLDGVRHDFTEDLKGAELIVFSIPELLKRLPTDVITTSSENMIVEKWLLDGDLFLYCLNRQDSPERIRISVKTGKRPVILDLRTGKVRTADCIMRGKETVIEKDFAPNEELALYFTDRLQPEENKSFSYGKRRELKEFRYRLLEDNFLVLNKCDLYFNEALIAHDYSVYADLTLRKKLGLAPRGNQMLQPWFRKKFFPDEGHCFGKVRLHYEFQVRNLPENVRFLFEPQSREKILLNGKEITGRRSGSPIDCSFRSLSIPNGFFHEGRNSIDIIFSYSMETNVEDHYLMGKFGVKAGETDTIISLPPVLHSGSIQNQGFPYFGGKMVLEKNIDNGVYEVHTKTMGPASILVNGSPLLFPPYRALAEVKDGKMEIEIAFTRQNTFGIIGVINQLEGLKDQGFDTFTIRKAGTES